MAESPSSLFVTQAEFSRQRGVSKKTVTIWKSQGYLVMTEAGLVDVKASNALLSSRPASYRGGVTKGGNAESNGVESPPPLAAAPEIIASAEGWTLVEATRVKENYLARLRKQEFELAEGKLVEIADVRAEVEQVFAVIREKILSLPGKLADALVGRDRASIEKALRSEVTEVLNELHDPASYGARARGA